MDTPTKPIIVVPEETTKQEKKRRNRDVHVKPNKKVRLSTFRKRYETLKRKAGELEKLCDTPVCMVCYGPDGEYYTLPEDREKTKDTIIKFRKDSDCGEIVVEHVDLLGFLENKKKKLEGKKTRATVKDFEKLFASWNEKIPELCEKSLENFNDFLENKIQLLTERLKLLEEEEKEKEKEKEKGKATQLASSTCCSYNQMDMGSSSLLGVSNSNNGFGIPEISDLMNPLEFAQRNMGSNTGIGIPQNFGLMVHNNNSIPMEFAHTNMGVNPGFGIPPNSDLGYNNNTIPMAETNRDFPLEFAQRNMGLNTGPVMPENINMMGYNCNILPNNDFPLEFAQTTTNLGTMKNSETPQLSTLHYTLPRSMKQTTGGNKNNGYNQFSPSYGRI